MAPVTTFWSILVAAFAVPACHCHEGLLTTRACTQSYTAKQGDTCASVATAHGITITDFIRDNPSSPSCQLTAGAVYCVAVDAAGPPGASSSTPATSPSSTSSTPGTSSSAALKVSSDGTCGNGVTCLGSKFGDCCSEHGYCGGTDAYCSAGCQNIFGSCSGASGITSPSPPSTVPPVTITKTVVSTVVSTVSGPTVTVTGVGQTAPASISTVTTTIIVPASVSQVIVVSTITSVAVVSSTIVKSVTSTIVTTATVSSTAVVTSTTLTTSTLIETRAITTISTLTTISTVTVSLVVGPGTTPTLISTVVIPPPVTTSRPSPTPPSRTLPNTDADCTRYYQLREGDTCSSIETRFGISQTQFLAWNRSVAPALGNLICSSRNIELVTRGVCKVSCESLWEGYAVCIGA